jgi:hypothetical protein
MQNSISFCKGIVKKVFKNWRITMIVLCDGQKEFELQVAELGYGTYWIGAFDETKVKELLAVTNEKKVLICMTFGRPAGEACSQKPKGGQRFRN